MRNPIKLIRYALVMRKISKKNFERIFTVLGDLGFDSTLISTHPDCPEARLFYASSEANFDDKDEAYLAWRRLLTALKTELENQNIDLEFKINVRKESE